MLAIKTTDLEVSRSIPATTPDQVFAVWLDPNVPGGPWFGPSKVILDAKVDGLFHHAVVHGGRSFAHYGRFVRIEAPSAIEHTWVSEATRGLETTVHVSFTAQGTDTHVVLRHTGVPDDAAGRQHADGWGFVLLMLEESMAKRQG